MTGQTCRVCDLLNTLKNIDSLSEFFSLNVDTTGQDCTFDGSKPVNPTGLFRHGKNKMAISLISCKNNSVMARNIPLIYSFKTKIILLIFPLRQN
jgi:hypothetical protein